MSAQLPQGPLLVVSPHRDDAALSCGALLDRGEPVTILDVFTQVPEPEQQTEWDARSGFAGSYEATATRAAEEAAAFAGSGHELVSVGLLDGQYLPTPRDERDGDRLTHAVAAWVDRSGPCTVAIPAGVGLPGGARPTVPARLRAWRRHRFLLTNDSNHLFVRDTVVQALRDRPEVTIWLYEELPHRWSRTGRRVVPLVARWAGRAPEPRIVAVDVAAKTARLAAFETQLPIYFRSAGNGRLARRIPRVEHYWVLPPAA